MLRQVLKNAVRYRCHSAIFLRQKGIEDHNSKEKHVNTETTQDVDSREIVKERTLNQTISNYNPVTAMPLAELNQSTKGSSTPFDITEFIDSLGPPLPISFNMAAYVNQSESLQKLVQLGVDLSAIELKPENAKYILKLEFEKDMKPHIQFLHDHGVEANLLGKFITKNPLIFKTSIEDLNIRFNYLNSKKFSDDAISRIIGANPYFLSWDTKAIDTRLGFLQKQFSLSGNEVRYLVTKSPKLVTYDFMKFKEKLFVMKEELGFRSTEMKVILLEKPKVWMIGRKQLRERFHYLHNIMSISHEQILAFPNVLLSRSLILNQRHQYLVHLNRAQYDPKQPMYISLEDLATTTDSVFCEKCAKTSVEEYNEFLRQL